MSDTAAAVETALTETFAPEAPAAPEIVSRDAIREQILSADWKEEPELIAERTGETPEAAPETAFEAAQEGEQTESEPEMGEPPAEAVIGEGGNQIVVRTPDGKFAQAPEVKLEFRVGEKVYLKDVSEVVRMARDGVVGQQYREEVKQYREVLPQVAQKLETMEAELEAQRALNLELLNDPERYFARKEEWERLNAPEERLRRLEAEREQEWQMRRANEEQARRQNTILSYYTEAVKPVQDELLNGFPEVSLEAKMGRISLDTAPLLVNGIIPPERLPEYRAYLQGPFAEWVKGEAAKMQQADAKRQQLIEQERKKAQQVVQSVGRQVAPNGKAAPSGPPPRPAPRNRDEAKAAIIQRGWQDF